MGSIFRKFHIYFFITRFFRKEKKKRSKIERLNIKTIRFDKKKWKDNLVLHYLISKWIFFLITFRRHQDLQILISPKSLILQTKKFLENDAWIQKRLKRLGFCRKVWLTQRPLFTAFANKSLTFKCFINDVGSTIFFWNAERLERTTLL